MATGYLYEGSINKLSRIVINGSTVFYIILDNYDKPIRLFQENIKASDLANLVFAQIGDQVRIRCDWSNKMKVILKEFHLNMKNTPENRESTKKLINK